MGINNEESTDAMMSKAICQAFKHIIETIENEPCLILEGEVQPVEEENTFKEIRSWLFGRRGADGHTNSSADK
jgi:hypothetical protein